MSHSLCLRTLGLTFVSCVSFFTVLVIVNFSSFPCPLIDVSESFTPSPSSRLEESSRTRACSRVSPFCYDLRTKIYGLHEIIKTSY